MMDYEAIPLHLMHSPTSNQENRRPSVVLVPLVPQDESDPTAPAMDVDFVMVDFAQAFSLHGVEQFRAWPPIKFVLEASVLGLDMD